MDKEYQSITKLIGPSNYHTWAEAAMAILIDKDHDLCLEPSDTDATTPKISDSRKQLKARACLIKCVDESLLSFVSDHKTGFTLWNALKELYDDDGLSHQVALFGELVAIRRNQFDSMDDYIKVANGLIGKLTRAGIQIPTLLHAIILLMGLGKEFTPLIMGIQSSGAPITGSSIQSKLYDWKGTTDEKEEASAFKASEHRSKSNFTHASPGSSTNSAGNDYKANPKKFKKKQNYANAATDDNDDDYIGYGWTATIMNQCDELDDMFEFMDASIDVDDVNKIGENDIEIEVQRSSNYSSTNIELNDANIVKPEQASLAVECEVTFQASNTLTEWIVDSGASSHMAHDLKIFNIQNNAETHLGHITTANNVHTKIAGKGNLTPSVCSKEIRAGNVACAPDLDTNFLSMNEIAKYGNRVVFEGNKCTIYDAHGTARATCEDNRINKLKSETKFASLSTTKNSGFTTWHKRLDHQLSTQQCAQ